MTMQRQYFPPNTNRAPDSAVILNLAVVDDYQFYVKKVDEAKVGDLTYGSGMIYEIHVSPGMHKLNVIIGFISGGQPVYAGDINCDLQPNKFYTIEKTDNIINTSAYLTSQKINITCVQHETKPPNTYLENLAKKRNGKLKFNENFYEPSQ